MHIGVCTIYLRLYESDSLKDKRRVIKSIKDRVRNKFNVSIAEIEDLDKWQRATLGVVCVSKDAKFANSVLSNVINLIEEVDLVELADYEIEIQ